MTIIIYHEHDKLATYIGTPPDVGEAVWILDYRKVPAEEIMYRVESRMFYAEVFSDGRVRTRVEVMVREA